MEQPPPPPPPHGSDSHAGPKSGGLPDGKYDIFVIPPSSAGSGFIYLPSMNTQRNSFLAGVVCSAATFVVYQTTVPLVKEWFYTTINGGGSGVLMLMVAVAVISWAMGKTQGEGAGTSTESGTGKGSSGSRSQSAGGEYTRAPPPPPPRPPTPPHERESQQPPPPQADPPPQGAPPPPKSSWQRPQPANATGATKSSWEKAREETRKREDEKRRAEEIKRRREELEKDKLRQREKEARERLERELKEKREREMKDLNTRKDQMEKDRKEREDRERREREQRDLIDRLERERRERDDRDRAEREAKELAERLKKEADEARAAKKPPIPTAATEREDDAYSFRPYDRRKPSAKTNSAGSVYSEDSYAPSATTAKTTPPPSVRGPYSTKDPDKIIIKAVYSFNNAFQKTPIAQLVSGSGIVTDGLILRITTEGLFIDDDVRSVPQREWDIKAWTMKLAESCEVKGLHVLRASIRDQDGRRYVFIIPQSEGWKVAVGLQRLRRGTQVRALGVAGMPQNEAKALVENLGWG